MIHEIDGMTSSESNTGAEAV